MLIKLLGKEVIESRPHGSERLGVTGELRTVVAMAERLVRLTGAEQHCPFLEGQKKVKQQLG